MKLAQITEEQFLHGIQNNILPESDLHPKSLKQIALNSLLFQLGYKTIENFDKSKRIYMLRVPNNEVREALNLERFQYLFGDDVVHEI